MVGQPCEIPGFMSAVTMPRHVSYSQDLQKPTAGAHVHADDVVAKGNDTRQTKINIAGQAKSKGRS
jgi:hypothetical protein